MYLTKKEIEDIINDEVHISTPWPEDQIGGIGEAARRIAEIIDEEGPEGGKNEN